MRFQYTYMLRGLVSGEAVGELHIYLKPLSIYGEIDPKTGTIRGDGNPAGKILVIERHRGSTVAPYILYGLSRRGLAPKGIVIVEENVDPILVAAAVMANIPLAAGVPRNAILDILNKKCIGRLIVSRPKALLEVKCT